MDSKLQCFVNISWNVLDYLDLKRIVHISRSDLDSLSKLIKILITLQVCKQDEKCTWEILSDSQFFFLLFHQAMKKMYKYILFSKSCFSFRCKYISPILITTLQKFRCEMRNYFSETKFLHFSHSKSQN